MSESKIYGLIGLAKRAGKTVSGSFLAEETVRSGKMSLLILAEDASDGTKKKLSDKCRYYRVPVFLFGNRERLGKAVGEGDRICVGICDSGFAGAIVKLLETSETQGIEKQGE